MDETRGDFSVLIATTLFAIVTTFYPLSNEWLIGSAGHDHEAGAFLILLLLYKGALRDISVDPLLGLRLLNNRAGVIF